MNKLTERLRRTYEFGVDADEVRLADIGKTATAYRNPDGPEAADALDKAEEALGECQDKLWVIHFGLKDEAERAAAINACNMASAALANIRKGQDHG